MNKLQETLLILHHFDSLISGRTDFCKRNVNFSIQNCVTEKMLEKIKNGSEPKALKDDPILSEISRECADIRIILHSYISLNIIDMFSFNDEYNDFFYKQRFEDEEIKLRIDKVKEKNKVIRKSFDWDKLKRIRNTVLAHNMRDKKDNYNISLTTLKELHGILSNLKFAIEYSEVTMRLFDNIKDEFENEIIEAQKVLMNEIRNLT